MGNLSMSIPAISIRRIGADREETFKTDQIEQIVPGKAGYITLKGGPSLYGNVRWVETQPLRDFRVPNPEDRTPKQLAARESIGKTIFRLASAQGMEPMSSQVATKECTHCHEQRPLAQFQLDNATNDLCVSCFSRGHQDDPENCECCKELNETPA